MLIDVKNVPQGHSEIEQESRLLGFEGELPPFAEPVRCMAAVDRMEGLIVLNLRFEGAFDLECARCLEVYRQPVGGELRLIIKEEWGRFGPSMDDGAADFYFDVNHELVDVGSAIYDEIMTALPLKPLCSDGCEGIKIEGAAGGDIGGASPLDPRWAELTRLKFS